MESIRERLEAFWSGERPEPIPFTVYRNQWRQTADDPAWPGLFQRGIGVTWGCQTARLKRPDVEYDTRCYRQDGSLVERRTIRTPLGELYEVHVDGWRRKFLLETREDYALMTWIVRRTEIEPDYDALLKTEREVAPYGIAHAAAGRTPMQTILVDYVGLENLGLHLFDLQAEVMALYEALLQRFRKIVQIIAEGPGRYVSVLENFSSETMGPTRFKELHLPVYQELFPILQSAGKVVGTHFDGRLLACRDLIRQAPIDLIESLTPPPEGDMSLAECRAAWPDKLLWSNINIACYELPPEQLRSLVLERVVQAAPDGQRLAFEVSEQSPGNWRESFPIVLDALAETRT